MKGINLNLRGKTISGGVRNGAISITQLKDLGKFSISFSGLDMSTFIENTWYESELRSGDKIGITFGELDIVPPPIHQRVFKPYSELSKEEQNKEKVDYFHRLEAI